MYFNIISKIIMMFFIIICLFLNSDSKYIDNKRILFSWQDSEVLDDHSKIFSDMKKLNFNTIYQGFSDDLKDKDITHFLRNAAIEKIDVYMLCGSPNWVFQENRYALNMVETTLKINNSTKRNSRIKGIVFDVEPYLLEEWEDQKEEIMNKFVTCMKTAYKKAYDGNLEVIVCVPYYYDDIGLNEQLKDLISKCSDGIAVMNYYQNKEYKHIKNESNLTTKYNKKIINIYELQAPGEKGLTEKHTYYEEGVKAAEENFIKLKNELENINNLSVAFHEYKALKEVESRE